MKLAWIIQGPPPAAWSYYIQMHLFTKYLNHAGHTAEVIQFTQPHQDLDDILAAIATIKPDILFTIGDVHLLNLSSLTRLPLISIVTNGTGQVDLDHPYPGVTFACTTHYAQSLYQNNGISPIPYLPHGFDPHIFRPGNRQQARKKLGWDFDSPVILMLGTNYPINPNDAADNSTKDRKNWLGGLTAFKNILTKKPKARLYLHTNAYGAVDLPQLINQLGLSASVDIADTTNAAAQSHLALLYQASNVLLFPSIGESFGVPLIEAQACGLPVVTTAAGPMPELVKTGTAVSAAHHPIFPGWGIPDTAALTQALLQWLHYDSPAAVSKKIQSFNIEVIMKHHFLPLLTQVTSHGHR
jgi:glycosyltransferase involved in cell wall biosynthesis